MRGLSLGLSLQHVLERFVPSDLFASGESGAWYDVSDMSTLFQDAAGTTPVTGPGDPVGQMLDKSGNGLHLTAPTSAARPVMMQDAGGRNYLDLDGVDDILDGPPPPNHAFSTLSAGFQMKQSGLNGPVVFGVGLDAAGRFFLTSLSGATRVQREPITGGNTPASIQADTLQVTTVRVGPGVDDFHFRYNGVDGNWTATGAQVMDFGGIWGFHVGAQSNNTRFAPLRFWGGIYVVRALTDAELSKVDQYLAMKTGVTL